MLSVDGPKVEDTKVFMVAGIRPYSISISSKGDLAVLTNQGGGQGDTDIIRHRSEEESAPYRRFALGRPDPRGRHLLPDGSHVAVTIQNGSSRPRRTSPTTTMAW